MIEDEMRKLATSQILRQMARLKANIAAGSMNLESLENVQVKELEKQYIDDVDDFRHRARADRVLERVLQLVLAGEVTPHDEGDRGEGEGHHAPEHEAQHAVEATELDALDGTLGDPREEAEHEDRAREDPHPREDFRAGIASFGPVAAAGGS